MAIIPDLAFLAPLIQDNTLRRHFHDSLYPELLFRMEATRERWQANIGDTLIETRDGLLPLALTPITPGEDPIPQSSAKEQWRTTACQYGGTHDTNMPSSRAAMASLFARDSRNMALQAGRTLNRTYRNKLFSAYLGGNTHTNNADTDTALPVGSISGFTTVLADGQEQNVSAAFPKGIKIGAGATAASVTAAVANDPVNFPLGAGVLTLAASTTWLADDIVVADDAPNQVNSGGFVSTDGLAATNILALGDVRLAIARMQANSVPPHPDGHYHVHLDPFGVDQVFRDAEFQNLNQSNYSEAPFQQFAVGKLLQAYWYRNVEAPGISNTGGGTIPQVFQANRSSQTDSRLSSEISADVRNADGVAIQRTVVTGGSSGYEKYIPEADYITEAGTQGVVGGFTVTTNGMQLDLEGIRYILRSPQDRLGQVVSHTWSFSGDWGIPSDINGGRDSSRFKRAVVINSGVPG